MSHPYPTLLRPWRLGRLDLRNRIALAPMTVAYGNPDGSVSEAEVAHYERRARGGVGLVITEHVTIDHSGRQLPRQTVVERADLAGLATLAERVHRQGAAIVAQIGHAGRYAGPWDRYEQRRRLAPSAVPFRLTGERVVTPQEMTTEEIEATVAAFATAAEVLTAAGFDGVQIHASQGFLPSQFLSPRINRRTDGYGGDRAGRTRFLLDVVRAVRPRLAPDGVLGVQLLADEGIEGGWALHDAVALAGDLAAAGVDFLLPSVTTFETVAAMTARGEHRRWGYQLGATVAIAAAVDIAVLGNGGITEPAYAEEILRLGLVDAVALARPLLADPDWAAKAGAGHADTIRTCPCTPASCLRTQLTGAVCQSWSEDERATVLAALERPSTPDRP